MTNVHERVADALRLNGDSCTRMNAERLADVVLSLPVVIVDDSLLERLDDALEDVLNKHYTLPDYECSCGKINNMDGDVLHAHRLGALSKAIELVLLADAAQPASK